jgi:hypothetical protein
VGDRYNHVVRMIHRKTSIITTIVGNHKSIDEEKNNPNETDRLKLNLPSSLDYHDGRLFVPTDITADVGDLIVLRKLVITRAKRRQFSCVWGPQVRAVKFEPSEQAFRVCADQGGIHTQINGSNYDGRTRISTHREFKSPSVMILSAHLLLITSHISGDKRSPMIERRYQVTENWTCDLVNRTRDDLFARTSECRSWS